MIREDFGKMMRNTGGQPAKLGIDLFCDGESLGQMHFRKLTLVTVVTAESKLESTGNRSKERGCTGL